MYSGKLNTKVSVNFVIVVVFGGFFFCFSFSLISDCSFDDVACLATNTIQSNVFVPKEKVTNVDILFG